MNDRPNRDDKAFSLFLTHSFAPFSSLGRGLRAVPAVPPGSNASTKTLIAIPMAVSTEATVMSCSRNSVLIHSGNEVSLSNTLAIVSLKLVIWLVSLPFRTSMPDFQFVIRLGDVLLDFFSLHICVVQDITDFLKLVSFSRDLFF